MNKCKCLQTAPFMFGLPQHTFTPLWAEYACDCNSMVFNIFTDTFLFTDLILNFFDQASHFTFFAFVSNVPLMKETFQ